jgi:hypothetical protein
MKSAISLLLATGALGASTLNFDVAGSTPTGISLTADAADDLQLTCASSASNLCEVASIKSDLATLTTTVAAMETRLSALEAAPAPAQDTVYDAPRTADDKQIWDDNSAGGRFCVSQLGPGATFVKGTQALGSVSGCQPCSTFNADKTCASTIGTCHSFSSITCAPPAVARLAVTSMTLSSLADTDWAREHDKAANCNDDSAATYCHNDPANVGMGIWLSADLGAVKTIDHLKILNRGNSNRVGAHVIETSTDASTWTQCFTGTLPSTLGPFTEACAATGRYVRIKKIAPMGENILNLGYVQVFGRN